MRKFFSNLCKNIFFIDNSYVGSKKYKIYHIFRFKIKIRVRYFNNLRIFIKNSKPTPLDKIIEKSNKKVYVSIVAIFKDEPDILEWIEYHILIGVERFYLYDNESDEKYYKMLQPYIDLGIVVYKKIYGKCLQIPAYQDAIYRYKNETEWMAIIDLDEYIVPVEKDNLKDFLKDYEQYPAIVANWVMFDSNGLIERNPAKTVIESFTSVYRNYNTLINCTIKSIVKPTKVRYINSVHACIYKNNELAVNENFEKIAGGSYFYTKSNSIKKIRINHYHCKSRKEYIEKIHKGFADQLQLRHFDEKKINFSETCQDFVILKYLSKLKDRLQIKNKTTI